MTTAHIGKPISRVDGRAKVTGAAQYAGEHHVPGMVYGQVVSSTVAKATILRIETDEALSVPGVIQVFTHENAPRLADSDKSWQDSIAPPGSPLRPLQSDRVWYSGQPVALVVAEDFETARYAARLVRVSYEREPHVTDLEQQRPAAYHPPERDGIPLSVPPRGNADQALGDAAVRIDQQYRVPVEHHNPMEPYAATVIRQQDGTLLVYDKTQGVQNVQEYLCNVFGASDGQLRVLSPYVGGAFGSGLRPQYPVLLAVMAARELERSVRVTLTRQQMFTIGHRPTAWQRVALGASADGKLQALIHEAVGETSQFEDYSEPLVTWSAMLYQCDHLRVDHQVTKLDVHTPLDMRAPGAVWGLYALECAMDELADKLQKDPLALRVENYAERDQAKDLPFSSKELRECYRQASERFGWQNRPLQPRSLRDGNSLVGWGMASAAWEASQLAAAAKAVLNADGRLTVSSATADIGTGTYTIMTQIAAEALGLPLEDVVFNLGDSTLSQAPVEGGSFTAATVGSAVHAACQTLQAKLIEIAKEIDHSPLAGLESEEIVFRDAAIQARHESTRRISLQELLQQCGRESVDAEAQAKPGPERDKYSTYAHAAVFAEVKVDEDLGSIQATRIVTAVAAGRILNPKTARSQILGGIVWGVGSALHEETILDHNYGRFMNHNLAEYHIPVHADIHEIDVLFVDESDRAVNPLGVKGLGEIGVVGVAAAIANAVYHATGKRVRQLPITLDHLL